MAKTWQQLFKELNILTGEEGFDVTEESELSDEVWIRKQNRALAKWITNVGIGNYLYFKFITPIIDGYIYEPLYTEDLPSGYFELITTNKQEGDLIRCYIIINDIISTNPIIIPDGTEYLQLENLGDYFPEVPESPRGYLISLKFEFGGNLISPPSNLHIQIY